MTDTQSCFFAYVGAVDDGEYDLAADAQETYHDMIADGDGHAEDTDGALVLKLDLEQDRYLVNHEGIERWRKAERGFAI